VPAGNRNADKCARPGCGHRRDRHAGHSGCTKVIYYSKRLSSGRTVSRRRDCECTFFQEEAK
jgi:hypothetical protein